MLEIRGLSISYGGLEAVRDLSLTVAAGRITAILGPNGAGKSSIIQAIMGLVPIREGQIFLDGQPIHAVPIHERLAMGVSLVPEGRRLFPMMTVEENLNMGAYSRRARQHRQTSKAEVYNRFSRLLERRRQLAGSLSGGEQQQLALGRALMSRPRLLLLDEPSLGLSPTMIHELFDMIQQLNGTGVTIMLAEQNVYQTLKIADSAYVVEVGRMVHSGSGQALLNDPYVQQSYLGEI